MTANETSLAHICNVVRRQLQEAMKDLDLYFIIYTPDNYKKTLETKRLDIKRQPAGGDILPQLTKAIRAQPGKSFLAGLNIKNQKTAIPFVRTQRAMAVFFINAEQFEKDQNTKATLYHLVWHAISLHNTYKDKKNKDYYRQGSFISPKQNLLQSARDNMLADVFASVFMELSDKAFIKKRATQRALMTLQPIINYEANLYPYPVAFDSLELVMQEVLEIMPSKSNDFEKAVQITKEINLTYDDATLRQWQNFAIAAQEMAWLGFGKNRILSTAIYTCEDPYMRAMAYLMSEILNLEPAPLSNLGSHNPFTDPEANQRLHLKACEQVFKTLLEKLKQNPDINIVYDTARRQCQKMLNGHTIGWCAHAILRLASMLEKQDELEIITLQNELKDIFYEEINRIEWRELHNISRMVMEEKRANQMINLSMLIDYCEIHDNTKAISSTLENPLISASLQA